MVTSQKSLAYRGVEVLLLDRLGGEEPLALDVGVVRSQGRESVGHHVVGVKSKKCSCSQRNTDPVVYASAGSVLLRPKVSSDGARSSRDIGVT